MKKEKTARGFDFREFHDANNVSCSIQKSSIATADLIWLGCDDANLQEFVANREPRWQKVVFPNSISHHVVATTRMHLTKAMVKKLLPILQKFVETGDI